MLNAPLTANGHHNHRGAVNTIGEGRRGYEILDGRDLVASRPGEAVVEQGLAKEWDLHPGDRIRVGRELGELTIAGISNAPDNVAFPLATTARVYVSDATIRERLGFTPDDANVALLWLRDPGKADVTLTQARAVSFGLGKLEFVTREGVRVLLSQAAGIVISLLVAFSLVALVAAGTMLAAGAHADVQRRLSAFGVQRALGFSPGRIAALQADRGGDRGRAGGARGAGDRDARGRGPRPASCWPRSTSARPAARWRCRSRSRSSPCWRSSSPPRPGRRGAPRGARRRRSCAAATSRRAAPARRRAAACSASARASRPPRAGASSRRWRRSPSAPAWSC